MYSLKVHPVCLYSGKSSSVQHPVVNGECTLKYPSAGAVKLLLSHREMCKCLGFMHLWCFHLTVMEQQKKKKKLQCNHDTLNICHLNHLERAFDRLQCKLTMSFQSWSEWRPWPWSEAVHQPANCILSLLAGYWCLCPQVSESACHFLSMEKTPHQQYFTYNSRVVMIIAVEAIGGL